MRKAARNVELQVVLTAEVHSDAFSETGTADTQIDCNVPDASLHDPHQLRLGKGSLLVMQAADHSTAGFALIVLDKSFFSCQRVVAADGKGFEEIATAVSEHFRANDYDARQLGCDHFHISAMHFESEVLQYGISNPKVSLNFDLSRTE